MKMTRRLIGIAATFAAAIYMAGCSNLFESATVDDSDSYKMVERGAQKRELIGNVDIAGNGGRTILPASFTDADIADFKYYLRGTSITGKAYNEGKNKALNPKIGDDGSLGTAYTGKFKESIASDIWDLTVFAVKGTADASDWTVSDILEKSVLIGYANVDLTSAATAVTFKLSPDGLVNPGSLAFNVILKNNAAGDAWTPPTGTVATYSVRNLITGEVISNGTSPLSQNLSFTDGVAPVSVTSIVPGTYNFVVTFKDANSKESGEWSDILVVLPGRPVGQDAYIPNIIGKEPAAPATFTACYYKDSEDVPKTGFYKVHFQWENTPDNEKYYEIRVIPIDGTADGKIPPTIPSTAVLYTQKGTRSETLKYFIEASERVDGSIFANNTDCTIYLELGREYQAQIRAVNAIGESDWVDVTFPTTAPTISGVDASNISCFATTGTPATADKCMNRYRITYNLNGGRYKTTSTAVKSSPKVVYNSIHDPENADVLALWGGQGADTATHDAADPTNDKDCLKKGSAVISNWVLSIDSSNIAEATVAEITAWAATTVAPTSGTVPGQTFKAGPSGTGGYTGYVNVTVYATYGAVSYDLNGSIDVTDPAKYKLLPAYVKYECSKTDTQKGSCGTGTDTSGAITISKKYGAPGTETVKFSVTIPNDDNNIKFDTISVEVLKPDTSYAATPQSLAGSALDAATAFAAIDVSGFDNGAYTVKVTGTAKVNSNTITRSCNITMTITD